MCVALIGNTFRHLFTRFPILLMFGNLYFKIEMSILTVQTNKNTSVPPQISIALHVHCISIIEDYDCIRTILHRDEHESQEKSNLTLFAL